METNQESSSGRSIAELKEQNRIAQEQSENYFAKLKQAHSIEDLGPQPEVFEFWCYWKHREIELKTKAAKSLEENPNVDELVKRLHTYPSDLSWAISESLMISKRLKEVEGSRKHWYNEKYLVAMRALKEQGQNSPAVKTIEAYIEQNFNDEWNQWEEEQDNLAYKKESLEKHLTLWMKLDKVYGNILYDLNTEFYRTYSKYVKSGSKDEHEFNDFVRKNGFKVDE